MSPQLQARPTHRHDADVMGPWSILPLPTRSWSESPRRQHDLGCRLLLPNLMTCLAGRSG